MKSYRHLMIVLSLWIGLSALINSSCAQTAAPAQSPAASTAGSEKPKDASILQNKPLHTFSIGNEDFLLDGKPLVIRCGELHFPRIPKEYWQHRLKMCRAMGLNAVCVYLFWNFHEWEPGRFNWEGQADVAEFCRLAQAEGLYVILRPGPYSCAEWEMGGLPWWLLREADIKLRTRDPRFLEPACRYLKEVGRILAPFQITRGGPLLMVQVENEYGSYGNDADYMGDLRTALIDSGFEVPLFACNPGGHISRGLRKDLFQVVNFGKGSVKGSFQTLRRFQATGPLMNGEYYPGWFDCWGRAHAKGNVPAIADDINEMLSQRASFSLYMAHGGTSFGMWSGTDQPFKPDTSSYDYDAPISEAGWQTPAFDALKAVFLKHLPPGEVLPEPPPANPVITIPPTTLTQAASVMADLPAGVESPQPQNMETLGQGRGMIVYRTTLPPGPARRLNVQAISDFGWVFVDGSLAGVLDRRYNRTQVVLPPTTAPARLEILVEAMGRVNFGTGIHDRKGLRGPVQIRKDDGSSQELTGWTNISLPLDDAHLARLRYGAPATGPAFWRGTLTVEKPGDTFLDLRTWGKGVVWINGRCLARYWSIGPTQTAYVPGPWLKAGDNEVVILDLYGPRKAILAGLDKPILDELHPELDHGRRTRASGMPNYTGQPPAANGNFTPDVSWQVANFVSGSKGRYVGLEILSLHGNKGEAAIAEIELTDPAGKKLSNATWQIINISSEHEVAEAENMLDGQSASCWTSGRRTTFPHWLVIDLGTSQALGSLRYLPRDGNPTTPGRLNEWRAWVSDQPFGLKP